MKKIIPLILANSFLVIYMIVTLTSCTKEGPAGKNGTNGTNGLNGMSGTAFCLKCHTTTNFTNVQSEFATARHSDGSTWAAEGGNRSCAMCHSEAGYQQACMDLKDSIASTAPANALSCQACHYLHANFDTTQGTDYAFRKITPVVFYQGGKSCNFTGSQAGSLVCIQCHQARIVSPAPSSMTGTDTIKLTSMRYGAHHGPQGNLFAGSGISGAYEFTGLAYTNGDHTTKTNCSTCHMQSNSNPIVNGGGHTVRMTNNGTKNDTANIAGSADNVAVCNTCHTTSTTSFDYKSAQTNVQALIKSLGDKINTIYPKPILNKTNGVYDGTLVSTITSKNPFKVTSKQAAAIYNLTMVINDASFGVHNYPYITALLTNTMNALP